MKYQLFDQKIFADIETDHEVYLHLTCENPVPGTDIDVVIMGPTFDLVYFAGREYNPQTPEILEEGWFWIPQGGMHYIYTLGYAIYETDGQEVTLTLDASENILDATPVESSGVNYGSLVSYVKDNYNAKLSASKNAAFNDVIYEQFILNPIYSNAIINVFTTDQSPFALPDAVFCESDPLAIGGVVWLLDPAMFDDFETAQALLESGAYIHYVDGIPISEMTKVVIGRPVENKHAGELVSYSRLLETGVFKAGELAGRIGFGQYLLTTEVVIAGSIIATYSNWFWLLEEGSLGPH